MPVNDTIILPNHPQRGGPTLPPPAVRKPSAWFQNWRANRPQGAPQGGPPSGPIMTNMPQPAPAPQPGQFPRMQPGFKPPGVGGSVDGSFRDIRAETGMTPQMPPWMQIPGFRPPWMAQDVDMGIQNPYGVRSQMPGDAPWAGGLTPWQNGQAPTPGLDPTTGVVGPVPVPDSPQLPGSPSQQGGGAGGMRPRGQRPQRGPQMFDPANRGFLGGRSINDINNLYGIDATGWYDEQGNITPQGMQGWHLFDQGNGGMQAAPQGAPQVPPMGPRYGSPYYGGFQYGRQ